MKTELQIKPLQALCDNFKQDIVDGPFGSNLQRKDYSNKGIPVLKIQNVKPFAIELKKMDYVSSEKFQELRRHSFRRGDIVMTKLGSPLGVSAIVEDLDEGIIVADLVRIRAQNINTKYLCYHLNSQRTNDFINSMQKGTTRPRVTLSVVRELPIFVPSPDEQKRIVRILDKTFEAIAIAKENTEQNHKNAQELYRSNLQAIFRQNNAIDNLLEPFTQKFAENINDEIEVINLNDGKITKTGGRAASLRHIPGPLSLSVGMPKSSAKQGWQWSPLGVMARLETGHTPSRKHPEYWGGSIPWIGIKDARAHHGQRITNTSQSTNGQGIANSSARVLPRNTVCLSRTASVGYVLIMDRPMATSQDFINWVCSKELMPDFLMHLFLAEGREGLLRYASGSVHQTIYFPEAKAFHICHPDIKEQERIVKRCHDIRRETHNLEIIYQKKILALDELKKSLLHAAFSGKL